MEGPEVYSASQAGQISLASLRTRHNLMGQYSSRMPQGVTLSAQKAFWMRLLLLIILVTAGGCREIPSSSWHRTELYFGLSQRGGQVISEADFSRFVAEQVTPRFPDGFTILQAEGRYLQDGVTISEPSRVIILFHPSSREVDQKIDALAREFARRYGQDSVLRVDVPTRVSFVAQ